MEALFPIIFLIVLLAINIKVFGTEGLSGSNQLVLIFASGVAGIIAVFRLKVKWAAVEKVLSIVFHLPCLLY